MVTLVDIEISGNVIRCRYAPEDSEEYGYLEVDITTEEIVNVTYSAYPHGKKTYAWHARGRLLQLVASGEPYPAKARAMWY